MTFTRSLHDILALAVQLKSWVLALVAWLVAHLGEGPLSRRLRADLRRDVACAESEAAALCVTLALMRMALPESRTPRRGRQPAHAPRGFACGRRRGPDRRALTRRLFPREPSVLARVRRLGDVLGALEAHAVRLVRYLARVPLDEAPVARAPAPSGCGAGRFMMRSAASRLDTS